MFFKRTSQQLLFVQHFLLQHSVPWQQIQRYRINYHRRVYPVHVPQLLRAAALLTMETIAQCAESDR